MRTLIPGSTVIPMLGVPSTLVSIDTSAVTAAAVCVGASLLLAWTVMRRQRHTQRPAAVRQLPPVVLPLARHAA